MSHFENIFSNFDEESLEQRYLQEKLAEYYNRCNLPPDKYLEIPDSLEELQEIRAIENAWIKHEEKKIQHLALPNKAKDFEEWYRSIKKLHKKDADDFFNFLAEDASLEQIAYYICLEARVDGRFDDIIALSQIGMDGAAKISLAENYWDEMGRGKIEKMHTAMFNQSVKYMKSVLSSTNSIDDTDTVASLKNGNLLSMYSLRKRFFPRLLGTIGVLEDTAPVRFSKVTMGLKRHNVPYEAIIYHEEHIAIDAKHGKDTHIHVLMPLINRDDPALISEIAIGMLIRYNIAIAYYDSIKDKIKLYAAR